MGSQLTVNIFYLRKKLYVALTYARRRAFSLSKPPSRVDNTVWLVASLKALMNSSPANLNVDESILEGDPRWEAAQRAARSSALSRATQLRSILVFVVRHAILLPEEPIHEFDIAYRVLGRRSDFNPLDDNIVRVQMGHLRKRLDHYFSTEGKNEEVVISLALGSYKPLFSDRSVSTVSPPPVPQIHISPSESPVYIDTELNAVPVSEPPRSNADAPRTADRSRWVLAGMIAAGTAVLVLGITSITLWNQVQSVRRSLYPWRYSPAVASFWSGFVDDSKDTDIVLADSSFSLIQTLGKKSFTLNDYLNRNYTSQFQDLSPEMVSAFNTITNWNLATPGDFELAHRFLALDPLGNKFHLYYARKYMSDLIRRDNVILVGSRIANPWAELFEDRMNFTIQSNDTYWIANRAPAAGEQKIYTWAGSVGYCVVAYLPNPNHNGNVLLIEGTSSESTEAAGDFLLSEDQLSNFEKMLHVTKLPYFEILLKTSWIRGTPFRATIEAYRTYPNLH